jgi:hypothetical protein
MDDQTLWGHIVYAPTAAGHRVVDALSAALLAKSSQLAREIRIRHNRLDVETLEFHTTSWHGAPTRGSDHWSLRPRRPVSLRPDLGEIVEVHLNADNKLVAVWYAPKDSR